MDLYEAIKLRRSVRHYKQTSVPEAALNRIFEAARLAPSACNRQPWKFLVLKTAEKRKALAGLFHDWVITAPLMVVALGHPEEAWELDGRSIHEVDIAIAFEHMVLAATAEGLGTCWICAYNHAALDRALGVEPGWKSLAVTPLGYPDDSSPRMGRKPIEQLFKFI